MDSKDSASVENEEEAISDAFTCCVCLDLLYKPIVLQCGHVSCFWCVHHSMNGLRESHCPICRQTYYHFPTICQVLHDLLLKIYPNAYKTRETQILEQERRGDVFSPQIPFGTHPLQSNKEVHQFGKFNNSNLKPVDSVLQHQGSAILGPTSGASSVPISGAVEVDILSDNLDGISKKASISDVLCSGCTQMLFRPVVLNCGHVYCEACIIKPANELLRCSICQCPHPIGVPKVCLVLDQFLEEQFPEDYKQKKQAVKLKQDDNCNDTLNACTSSTKASEEGSSWWNDSRSKIHIGVGCDLCGMYPIIGDRYKCKDCKEKIGFDLCADCYNTKSKLPGRFNQQHKPEHEFDIVRSNTVHNIMFRLITEQVDMNSAQFDDGTISFPISGIVAENTDSARFDDGTISFPISGNVAENTDFGPSEDAETSENNATANDSSEDQTNEQLE